MLTTDERLEHLIKELQGVAVMLRRAIPPTSEDDAQIAKAAAAILNACHDVDPRPAVGLIACFICAQAGTTLIRKIIGAEEERKNAQVN